MTRFENPDTRYRLIVPRANFLNGHYSGLIDLNGELLDGKPKRSLDSLDGTGFNFQKKSLDGAGFNFQKKSLDKKRALDSMEGDNFGFKKRALDMMDGEGFGMKKKSIDEGDGFGFGKGFERVPNQIFP